MDKVRLLICHTCSSIQELPDYEGDPERDDTLNYRLAEHRFPSGDAHIGIMGKVGKDHWDKPAHRQEIVEKIREAAGIPGEGAGLGQTFYDVKANFQEDALKCWKRHNRTHDCSDYMTDKMILLPDTKAERKSEGLPDRRPNTFLCQFCPVHQIVLQRQKSEKYKYNYDG